MAKYTGPSNKLFRNYGVTDLSNRKLVSSLRQNASGQHGAARKKLSEYAIHLNEKQKIPYDSKTDTHTDDCVYDCLSDT